MRTFDPLGSPFAREVSRRFQLPRMRSRVIGVEAFDPKRLQELLQLPQHCVFAPAKHIREDCAAVVIDRMPQPPGRCLLAHVRPHLVDLSRFDSLNYHLPLVGVELREPRFVHRLKLALLFFSSLRTVSVLMLNTESRLEPALLCSPEGKGVLKQ
jgi:hypothetical protein